MSGSVAMSAEVAEMTMVPRPPKGREAAPVQISRLLHAHEIVLKEARTMAQQAARDGDDGGLFVAGRAELRPITIGRDYGSRVEVVSGLQPSDEVILDPADSLTSGTAVRVQEQSASSR